MFRLQRFVTLFLALFVTLAGAFCTPPTTTTTRTTTRTTITTSLRRTTTAPTTTTTALAEQQQRRRWNFNQGQSPWGMKKNAEIWNGRVAQMAFVIVFLQELIQGKGIVQGLQEGNAVNMATVAMTALSVLGLTAWLAWQGDDDFTSEV